MIIQMQMALLEMVLKHSKTQWLRMQAGTVHFYYIRIICLDNMVAVMKRYQSLSDCLALFRVLPVVLSAYMQYAMFLKTLFSVIQVYRVHGY